ncbi:hypothetical protein CDAR_511771 [Caerostris darwini]|uniref:Uncharacterized protein n=1 Tax=Caerostris darwini TaxID=1538125 RepID=A0AAV4P3P1_9ARAC|nr:hypothetical protein CDAR_511771 [Caerostris darwini]
MFGTPAKIELFGKDVFKPIEYLRTEDELQALIKTVNNASENNSKIEDNSVMNNNDSLQNDYSPEVTFETQKYDETAIPLTQTYILSRQEKIE